MDIYLRIIKSILLNYLEDADLDVLVMGGRTDQSCTGVVLKSWGGRNK